MKILVINSGSSSIKYQLIELENGAGSGSVIATGLVERIGEQMSNLEHTVFPKTEDEREVEIETPIDTHEAGLTMVINLLVDEEKGVIANASEIAGVGHRVVHGGEHFSDPTLVNDDVIKAIEDTAALAPLHNPPNLAGIKTAMGLFKECPHVAVFDTAFHQTMPAEAYMYAIPYELYEELGIRRYGFHGTSHKYVAAECAKHLGKDQADVNCITVHLGNGCSMAAVKGGKCIDTSMGMTPLAGLVMGTRTGDVDPAIYAFLNREKGMDIGEMDNLFNKQSGLKGVCGLNDMRDIHNAIEDGGEKGERCKLALDIACYRNRKYIGEYMAALGRTDAIVFTAGIGENDDIVRRETLKGMEAMGIKLDLEKNEGRKKQPVRLSTDDSAIQVWVIPTNEELEIARQTQAVLNG